MECQGPRASAPSRFLSWLMLLSWPHHQARFPPPGLPTRPPKKAPPKSPHFFPSLHSFYFISCSWIISVNFCESLCFCLGPPSTSESLGESREAPGPFRHDIFLDPQVLFHDPRLRGAGVPFLTVPGLPESRSGPWRVPAPSTQPACPGEPGGRRGTWKLVILCSPVSQMEVPRP